jgi:lipopolysaccharide exporter
MSERGHGIGTRTLRGMAWAYGAYVGGRALVLVSTAILARLLTPRDFGLVALALVFLTFLDAVKDFGLGQALIVSSDEEEAERAQTVFSWTVAIGAGLSLAMAGCGPLAAAFFDEPQLTGLLPAIGLSFFVRSLGATHFALARKQLNYRVRTISEISEVVVRGIVGIALALAGMGAWSLVIGFIAGAVTSSVALWALVPFRPRMRLTRTHLRDLLAFGGMLTVVDVGAVLAYNLDYVFIGGLLGATQLGLYSIAFRIPELVVLNLANVAGNVLFPAYSAIDRSRLREAYLVALRYTGMLTIPIAAGLAVLARPFVLVTFGDQWEASIPVMQILAAYAVCVTLGIPSGTVFKVTGQAWVLVAFTIPGLAVLVTLLAIFADQGIEAVAWCTTALQAASLPLMIWVASRRLDLPIWASVRTLAVPAAATLGMSAALVPVERLIDPALPALLAGIAVGGLVYGALLLVLAREDLSRLRRMAFPKAAAAR